MPGTSDPLTNLPLLHARVNLDYITNDFVARNSGISGSPETFYQKFIAVNSVKWVNRKIEMSKNYEPSTDTAGKDFYHYLVFLGILPRKSYGLQCAVILGKCEALIGFGEGHLRSGSAHRE